MISPESLHALAREMKSAQDTARQIEPFTARVPGFDLEASSGLGLSIVHTLVTSEMAGVLELRDDRGARARVRVPVPGPG